MSNVLMRWFIVAFPFVFWFPSETLGQNLQERSPLDDFLAVLENSGANVLAKSQAKSKGEPFQSSGFVKFKANFGVHSRIVNGTELRWIWNSDYVALVEKNQEQWSLKSLLTPDSEVYSITLESGSTASYFLGGPMLRRIESMDPAYSRSESNDSVYEYQYLPDSQFFSNNPILNSTAFRFDGNKEEPRLLEIRIRDSAGEPGNEAVIEWIQTFEYPNGTLFPVKIVANGALVTGSIPGIRDGDLWEGTMVELDEEAKFDRSECYLSHYGLPEPEFARKNRTWPWWLLGAMVVVAIGAFLWKQRAKAA